MQEMENKLEASTAELVWYRRQASSIEDKYLVLEREISHHCIANEEDSSQHKKMKDELSALRMRLVSERSVCCNFLTSLVDMLTSRDDYDSQATPFDSDGEMCWSELSVAVESLVRTLMNSLREAQEEIKCCKIVMERQNLLLESAADMHEKSVGKLMLEEREKEKQWEKRLEEIKKSYESMLMKSRSNGSVDLQSQHKDSEFEFEELKRLNCQLERLNTRLRLQLSRNKDSHRLYKSDRACLLACVCLLAGSLFRSQCQTQHLRLQKKLVLQLSNSGNLQPLSQVHCASEQGNTSRGNRHCKFRTVVIAVLAVHRLKKWKMSYWLLLSNFIECNAYLGVTSVLPCISGQASMGVASVGDIARWLRSERVLLDARRCFSGLQTSLDKHTLQERTEHVRTRLKRHLNSTSSKLACEELDKEFMTHVLTCHHNFLEKMRNHFC